MKPSLGIPVAVRIVAFQTFYFRRPYFCLCILVPAFVQFVPMFSDTSPNSKKGRLTKRENAFVAFRKMMTIFETTDKVVRF